MDVHIKIVCHRLKIAPVLIGDRNMNRKEAIVAYLDEETKLYYCNACATKHKQGHNTSGIHCITFDTIELSSNRRVCMKTPCFSSHEFDNTKHVILCTNRICQIPKKYHCMYPCNLCMANQIQQITLQEAK